MWAQVFRLDHPSGVLRMSSLAFDWTDPEGAEWLGGASVLQVSSRGPTAASDGGAVSVTWNGASAALIAEALAPGLLRARFEIATVEIDDATLARVGQPFDVWIGLAETPEVDADPAAPSITLTAQSPLLDLGRPRRVVLSPESQRRIDPDDTGADWVAQLADVKLNIRAP